MTPACSALAAAAAASLACYIALMFMRPAFTTLALLGALRVR